MKGFTLLEIILTLGIITVIAAFVPPVYVDLQTKVAFSETVTSYTSTLYRAQKLSEVSAHDSTWGVKITPEAITLFKGSAFATRDTSYDEVSSLFSDISFSGDSEVVFNKGDGTPSTKTSTTLTNRDGKTVTISVNEKGLIEY